MAAGMEKILFDRKTAALALSISVRSLDYLISGGQLKTKRMGRKILIHSSELKRFAQSDHLSIRPPIKAG